MKQTLSTSWGEDLKVAPYMGAWIETLLKNGYVIDLRSLPIWERGLKQTYMLYLLLLMYCRSLYGSVD